MPMHFLCGMEWLLYLVPYSWCGQKTCYFGVPFGVQSCIKTFDGLTLV